MDLKVLSLAKSYINKLIGQVATNKDEATEGQVLISNGDGTSTFGVSNSDLIQEGNLNKFLTPVNRNALVYETVDLATRKESLTGNPSTLTGVIANSPIKVLVETICTQSGTGNAHPDNIRPIVGYEGITVTVDNSTESDDYIATPITPIYGLTGYKDAVQLDTGVVTRKTTGIIYNGSENWKCPYPWNAENANFVLYLTIGTPLPALAIGSHFKKVASVSSTSAEGLLSLEGEVLRFTIAKSRINNPTDNATGIANFKTWLVGQVTAGTPVTALFSKASPTTENITSQLIMALAGTNTVTADVGDMSIAYSLTPNNYTSNVLFNGATTVSSSPVITLDEIECIKIDVTVNSRCKIYPLASVDGTTWVALNVRNQKTGNVFSTIYDSGSYIADVIGYKHFKASLVPFVGTGVTCSTKVYLLRSAPTILQSGIVAKSPKKPGVITPATVRISRNGTGYVAGATEGTIYSAYGATLSVSVNDGADFTVLYSFTAGYAIKRFSLLADDTIIVFGGDGTIYKSDTAKTTYVQVFQMVTPGVSASYSFGYTQYENIVGVCEYGSATPPNNARRAYLSVDYGATFTQVFEGATDRTYHLHGICYDPYSELLWIANGDGPASSNIHWSDDLGTTWHTAYEYGNCPRQWTGIVALPNCVLFTTDSKDVGVWRWDRLTTPLLSTTKLVLEPAFIIVDDYPGSEPIGTYVGKTYGANAVAYFGFSFFANNVFMPCKIWGTADGYEYYQIWESDSVPYSSSATSGIWGVSDPTDNGNILATYLSADDGFASGYNLIKIANPNWA